MYWKIIELLHHQLVKVQLVQSDIQDMGKDWLFSSQSKFIHSIENHSFTTHLALETESSVQYFISNILNQLAH